MYFQFGSYQHPANEVNLTAFEVTPRYSPRGREATRLIRMHLAGELICDDQDGTAAERQANLHQKIGQLIDAYSLFDMDQDAGLYHDDGTVTRHRLQSSKSNPNNLSGTKLAYRSWPKGEPSEYASGRSFYIILEAEYANSETELLDFQESVSITGNGGPRIRVIEHAVGPPTIETINEQTIVHVVQEGSITGFSGWIQPLGPLLPNYEYRDLRYIRFETPRAFGRGLREFTTRWRHVMVMPAYIPLAPHVI